MTVPTVSVTLPGPAAGLTAPKNVAEPWKQAVAQAVGDVWRRDSVREWCAVRLTFRLNAPRFRFTATFNLLKATIDGLSNVVFDSSTPGQGSPWHRKDWWITQLVAEKQLTSQTLSVRIDLGPVNQALSHPPGQPLMKAFVPGSPPLWPGDSVGQLKVLQWRAALCEESLLGPLPERM